MFILWNTAILMLISTWKSFQIARETQKHEKICLILATQSIWQWLMDRNWQKIFFWFFRLFQRRNRIFLLPLKTTAQWHTYSLNMHLVLLQKKYCACSCDSFLYTSTKFNSLQNMSFTIQVVEFLMPFQTAESLYVVNSVQKRSQIELETF